MVTITHYNQNTENKKNAYFVLIIEKFNYLIFFLYLHF